jgi:hypothetical protein
MLRSIISIIAITFLVSACSGTKSAKVASLQKSDKTLSCKEIMLEQNEAEFYRKTAEKNKGPSIKSMLMPLGYVSTFVDANKAIDASDSRIEYLNRIYDILDCDNPMSEANNRPIRGSGGYAQNGYGYSQPASYNRGGYGGGTRSDEWYW